MAADIRDGGSGFHRLKFKVEGGRLQMWECTVLISLDAHRKLIEQLSRARVHLWDKQILLKTWSRWEITNRLHEHGALPQTITITASDIDDFGAYTSDLARALLQAS
jgi:hypothetical protein